MPSEVVVTMLRQFPRSLPVESFPRETGRRQLIRETRVIVDAGALEAISLDLGKMFALEARMTAFRGSFGAMRTIQPGCIAPWAEI